MGTRAWQTVDIRPAPVGWRVLGLGEGKAEPYWIDDMPGWLLQEETQVDDFLVNHTVAVDASPGVVAGALTDGEWLVAAHDIPDFWIVLGLESTQPLDQWSRRPKSAGVGRKRRRLRPSRRHRRRLYRPATRTVELPRPRPRNRRQWTRPATRTR